MVAWPLYVEQKMNTSILSEKVGVAVRVKVAKGGRGVVCREQIVKLVKRVVVDEEGIAIKAKVKEMKLGEEKVI
ncbi:flavonol glycosyltransferase UGT72AG1 [Sesbania bispinosa]|nr:flavonol glycosyltransferase UGT72AG1 [Sesbania bispinosa]